MRPATPKQAEYLIVPYLCLFALLSVWAVLQPQYTWDLLGYIGCSVESSDPRIIHEVAFDSIRGITANKDIQADTPYRADVTANPYHFAEQLPFYSIKPVYVMLVKGLHRLGEPYAKATVTVSAVSNFLLAVLVWYWLSAYLSGLPLAATCSLIMLSPNILALSRWPTPDCLATLLAGVGLYLVLERRSYFWGCTFLLCDVWVRTDALVLAGIVFAVLLLLRKLDIAQFALLSFLALGSYFTINHFAGNYGWGALFSNSFTGGLTAPGEVIIRFSWSAYLHQFVRGAFLWLISGSFALYVLLAGLAVWLNRSSMYSYMIGAVLATRVLSYVLYPNGDQRYTAVLFVLVLVALVIAVRLSSVKPPTEVRTSEERETNGELSNRVLESNIA
jgi:hypothetical protein